MDTHSHKDTLKIAISGARRKIFAQSATVISVRTGVIALPVAAAVIAIDQRWGGGGASLVVGAIVILTTVLSPLFLGLALLGTHFRSAVIIDDKAALKNRLSSAWNFLHEGELDEARRVQVKDAIGHASALNYGALFGRKLPGASVLLPIAMAAFILSFLVPEYVPAELAEASIDVRTEYQLEELRALEEEIEEALDGAAGEELEEALEMLREIEEQFEQGEIQEGDVMIKLSRMDEEVLRKMAEMGVDNLEGEVDALVAPFMASDAGAEVVSALKRGEFGAVPEALKKLAEAMAARELSPKEMARLAKNMETAAAELGEHPDASSFKGDLNEAAAALKDFNPERFDKATMSMGKKIVSVKKLKEMKELRKGLQMAKLNMGQAPEAGQEGGEGGTAPVSGFEQARLDGQDGMANAGGLGKGGLKAGSDASGSPFGESSRLADSYRELLKIQGMAGEGPTETEIEYGEAEDAESQLTAKDIYAEYAAVAEGAIEREEIPLSHRFHVKRYFQAIKPVDED